MSTPPRDPEIIVKRVLIAVWAAVIIVASGFGFVACLIGILNDGHPILIAGAVGCLLGLVGGVVLARLAIVGNARRL